MKSSERHPIARELIKLVPLYATPVRRQANAALVTDPFRGRQRIGDALVVIVFGQGLPLVRRVRGAGRKPGIVRGRSRAAVVTSTVLSV